MPERLRRRLRPQEGVPPGGPAQPDFEGRNRRPFQVLAEGSGRLQSILQRVNEEPRSPFSRSGPLEDTIPLGVLQLHDNVLDSIVTTAQVETAQGEYELATQLTFPGAQSYFKSRISGTPIEASPQMERAALSSSSDLRALRDRINETGTFRADLTEVEGVGEGLVFTPISDATESAEALTSSPITLHRLQMPLPGEPQVGYCLHVTSEDFNTIPDNHQMIAQVTEEVVYAYYDIYGTPPPDATFTITPPPGLDMPDSQPLLGFGPGGQRVVYARDRFGAEQGGRRAERRIIKDIPYDAGFESLGGYEGVKEELRLIASGLRDPEIFHEEGITLPRGVLLYGPHGTGKSKLAMATANEAGATFFDLTPSRLLMSDPAEVENIFGLATHAAPSIIFIKDFDTIAGSHGEASQALQLLINSLFYQMADGRNEQVMIIGTATDYNAISPTYLRPGLFDDRIPVGLPSPSDREKIADIHMERAVELSGGQQLFAPNSTPTAIAQETPDFSGAEVEALIRKALARRTSRIGQGNPAEPLTLTEILREIPGIHIKEHRGQYL